MPGSGAQDKRNYLTYARTVLYKRLQDIIRTVDESGKVETTAEMSQRVAADRAQFVTRKMLKDLSQET